MQLMLRARRLCGCRVGGDVSGEQGNTDDDEHPAQDGG
jgi:hypothetical protein